MVNKRVSSFVFDPAGLRYQAALYRPAGDGSPSWEIGKDEIPHATVWAGLLHVSAKEATDGEQNASRVSIRLVMRHRSDLDGLTRLDFEGETYDLLSHHDPDMTRRWLIIDARSRQNAT